MLIATNCKLLMVIFLSLFIRIGYGSFLALGAISFAVIEQLYSKRNVRKTMRKITLNTGTPSSTKCILIGMMKDRKICHL